MNKKKILIIIASIIIIPIIIFISIRHLIIFTDIIPSSKKVAISYYIPVNTIPIPNKVSPALYIATNNEELRAIEKKYNINLSFKYEKYEEYKKDDFTYFIQFHNDNSIDKYREATDFIINKKEAYFVFDYNEDFIIHSDGTPDYELSGIRCSIAAVPNASLEPNVKIKSGYFVDDAGKPWNLFSRK